MERVIVLRLHPERPTTGADFATYLANLDIEAFDASFEHANGETRSLGHATIEQHGAALLPFGPLEAKAVASARILLSQSIFGVPPLQPPLPPEYLTTDLILKITRNGETILTLQVRHNVPLVDVPDGMDWKDAAKPSQIAAYIAIPAPNPDWDPEAVVDLPADGNPPNFAVLKSAVEKVLKSDPGPGQVPELDMLTLPQCRHIAKELVWNSQGEKIPYLTKEDFEKIYTYPPPDGYDPNARASFEGSLTQYQVTHEMRAEGLAKYIFTLCAAVACEKMSNAAESAALRFPLIPTVPPRETTELAVALILVPDTSFSVPAEHFYALAAQLPTGVTAETRYRLACLQGERTIHEQLDSAIAHGVIADTAGPGNVNPAQTARRLVALGATDGLPVCSIPNSANDELHALVVNWLDYPSDSIDGFWQALSGDGPHAHLKLVLAAITEEPNPQALVDAIASELAGKSTPKPFENVDDLTKVTASEWISVLRANNGHLLPEFTKPGTVDERINAFIRRLRQYFDVTSGAVLFHPPEPGEPASFGKITDDPIQTAFGMLSNPVLGQPIDATDLKGVAAKVFPDNLRAQAWLIGAVTTLNELYGIASAVETVPVMQFALMEALYARGFTSKALIAGMHQSDFGNALVGTVAYDLAKAIWQKAGGSQGSTNQPEGSGPKPINDGALVNCVPPPHLSPLGPIAYLHELLKLSAASTCSDPTPAGAQPTLATALQSRRGAVKDLKVTWANLHTPIPLIDLVLECLEAVVTNVSAPSGVTYDTAQTQLNGYLLQRPSRRELGPGRHEPEVLFAAMPEHSSPATPVKNPGGYDGLRYDFSSPILPYSQPLDICRSYLRELGTNRYSVMRHFRREITEFVLEPAQEHPDFRSHLWRYPVCWEIAREYLGINTEEEDVFTQAISSERLTTLYGYSSGTEWMQQVLVVSEFLPRTGLSYCDLYALIETKWINLEVKYRDNPDKNWPNLPVCEPCCLVDYVLVPVDVDQEELADLLRQLAVIIRYWRKLQQVEHATYSFAELHEIAKVLHMFEDDGKTNPDFARQLVAFQLLRDHFFPGDQGQHHHHGSAAIGPRWLQLLPLWKDDWATAAPHFVHHLQHYSVARFGHEQRTPEFLKLLADNLTALSVLAGFNPDDAAKTWHAKPTHTLRFAEILAKLCASSFGIGDILFLFTNNRHLTGDDPLPLASDNETLDSPLDLPDDDPAYSLWQLRRKLQDVCLTDEEVNAWSWPQIHSSLHGEFGFASSNGSDDPLSFACHCFPSIVEQSGVAVTSAQRQYREGLVSIAPLMWNTPPNGPFRYDAASHQLLTELPLSDDTVLRKLSRVRPLSPDEQRHVRNLYFAPRVDLAKLAFLFPNWVEADQRLIQGTDELARWLYFQRSFAYAHARCRVIAQHLAEHVAQVTASPNTEQWHRAWTILKRLHADEHRELHLTENDDGRLPPVNGSDLPSAGAFAALLGILGTGLAGEFEPFPVSGSGPVWTELRGPLDAFGAVRNDWNAPIPTVLPAMDLKLDMAAEQFVGVRNGFALQGNDAEPLGGAQGYRVTWKGALLIEAAGAYSFFAGAPTAEGEKPSVEACKSKCWRVTLTQGQRSWIVLRHHWKEPDCSEVSEKPLQLRRGVYDLVVEYVSLPPEYDRPELAPTKTGFQLKYAGPDTVSEVVTIPVQKLFIVSKDRNLFTCEDLEDESDHFSDTLYVSTLRDMRRTYQRAFKALLFSHRLSLSAKPISDSGQSELEYMLDQAEGFSGIAYYLKGSNPNYIQHLAWFDFNLLPVGDNYHSPSAGEDSRAAPSVQRRQALFDWWERLFDYSVLRRATQRGSSEAPVWLAFHEAGEEHPDDPAHLLRHMGVALPHDEAALKFYPSYAVATPQLKDELWAIRIWHADQWLRSVEHHFACKDVRNARPDLWATDEPDVATTLQPKSANQILTEFVQAGILDIGEPRRYEQLAGLNNGLRERARSALVAYLCAMSRVKLPWDNRHAVTAKDLSELLLLDVQCGIRERSSRIDAAITSAQLFIQRARLGLEKGWSLGPDFIELWESRFSSFKTWQGSAKRGLYHENTIAWEELETARRSEGFRFFEDQLRSHKLTIATPAGLIKWNGQQPPPHPGIGFLQVREPSVIAELPKPQPEGFKLFGTLDRHARPSWLSVDRSDQLGGLPNVHIGDGQPDSDVIVPRGMGKLPYWIEAAIRLGARFVRVAAAGLPMGSGVFDTMQRSPCCSDEHAPVIDEYYFWLLDTRYFDPVVQDANVVVGSEASGAWHDPMHLPKLLSWADAPKVHLFWARLHQGELKQVRRSSEGVRISDGSIPVLKCVGRSVDSLLFEIDGGVAPDGYAASPKPGFRYDLAADSAVVVPGVAVPPEASAQYLSELATYPFFLYFAPGAPLIPPTFFSQAWVAATALRTHCHFEAALKWYDEVFAPLASDASWCGRPEPLSRLDSGESLGNGGVLSALHTGVAADTSAKTKDKAHGSKKHAKASTASESIKLRPADRMTCCKGGAADIDLVRNRAVSLEYAETLLDWGDALMHKNTREAVQQARLIYDTTARILGRTPRTVLALDNDTANPVGEFKPASPPLNPRLMALYERTEERLSLIHATNNAQRLRDDSPVANIPHFGSPKPFERESSPSQHCAERANWCHCISPYRFSFLVQKARELAGEVRSLGGALLSAYEKGDAEYLASLRAGHELQLLTLALEVRQDQWREADWQVQALVKAKEIVQTRLAYYQKLVKDGLIADESAYFDCTWGSLATRSSAATLETLTQLKHLLPDIYLGQVSTSKQPTGSKMGDSVFALARAAVIGADILNTEAGCYLVEAGFERRAAEWKHQISVLLIELEQVERQILAAERRRDVTLRELNNHQRQMEQSMETEGFLRDKFTAHELYLYYQKETAALHRGLYDLAFQAARQAQRSLNFELGHETKSFLSTEFWDNLHAGMLAGERLEFALRCMEKEYLCHNQREYELTKHISLRQLFPVEFLLLKASGSCELELPEWLFDLDYPGQYMRRIKTVSLSLPCVQGPFSGVNCRLTLLSSTTRIDPRLSGPPVACCGVPEPSAGTARNERGASAIKSRTELPKQRVNGGNGYLALPGDSRLVKLYGAMHAIATSSGQNDAGLFEVNFRDERYLPFEFSGAVSRWRIELPQENNYFDVSSLADVVMNLGYTAREGGEPLRHAAAECAKMLLPDAGCRLFEPRIEFPDQWHRFTSGGVARGPQQFEFALTRDRFPFLPGQPDLELTRLEVLILQAPDARRCHPEHMSCVPAEWVVELTTSGDDCQHSHAPDQRPLLMRCLAGTQRRGLYHGVAQVQVGPIRTVGTAPVVRLGFPADLKEVENLLVVCGYRVRFEHPVQQSLDNLEPTPLALPPT